MACRDAYKMLRQVPVLSGKVLFTNQTEPVVKSNGNRLLFGVDSTTKADNLLQNNIEHFEWIVRNKIYPCFCARNIVGKNSLTVKEIDFIHSKGCKIAAFYQTDEQMITYKQGISVATKMLDRAEQLGIPEGTALFLEIGQNHASTDFLKGFARALLEYNYTPGFRADTDAKFSFDREYSRGMRLDRDTFERCLIWATSPILGDYDRMTTSHLIHPDNWKPFAPSGITRDDIAIWQYGKDCHKINDDQGKETTFNLNLVRNPHIITQKMF